jgi:aminoglycoside phosphotransferase (APT) family kinase protein
MSSENRPPLDWDQVVEAFDLGTMLEDPARVTGGLLHTMWRLTTTAGTFAVKQLNAVIMARPGIEQEYLRSEEVARAVTTADLPACAALVGARGSLLQAGPSTCLVFPWVEGRSRISGSVSIKDSERVGALLARIHSLDLQVVGFPALVRKMLPREQWQLLIDRAVRGGVETAIELHEALPEVLRWSDEYERADEVLIRRMIVSHRDLDQKNVLWTVSGSPVVIDWEAAGPINPTLEIAAAALDWSGAVKDYLDLESAHAMLAGYRRAGGTLVEPPEAVVAGCYGNWLGWLKFNIGRSVEEDVPGTNGRAIGVRESRLSLQILRLIESHREDLAKLLTAS